LSEYNCARRLDSGAALSNRSTIYFLTWRDFFDFADRLLGPDQVQRRGFSALRRQFRIAAANARNNGQRRHRIWFVVFVRMLEVIDNIGSPNLLLAYLPNAFCNIRIRAIFGVGSGAVFFPFWPSFCYTNNRLAEEDQALRCVAQ